MACAGDTKSSRRRIPGSDSPEPGLNCSEAAALAECRRSAGSTPLVSQPTLGSPGVRANAMLCHDCRVGRTSQTSWPGFLGTRRGSRRKLARPWRCGTWHLLCRERREPAHLRPARRGRPGFPAALPVWASPPPGRIEAGTWEDGARVSQPATQVRCVSPPQCEPPGWVGAGRDGVFARA